MLEDLLSNRILGAIVVVIAVPIILVGYILLVEAILRIAPRRWAQGLRPWLWIAPALTFLGVFLVYPTIATIIRSFLNRPGHRLRRARQLSMVLRSTGHPDRAPQQRALGGPAAALRRRHRPAGRRPGRSCSLREHGQDRDLPAARHQLRRCQRDLAVHVRTRSEHRDDQRGRDRARLRSGRLVAGRTPGTTCS